MTVRLVGNLRRERELEPITEDSYFVALGAHCGRLAGALKVMLIAPVDADVREIAQQVMDDFDGWRERTGR